MINQDRLVCSSTIELEQSGEAMIIFIMMMERELERTALVPVNSTIELSTAQ